MHAAEPGSISRPALSFEALTDRLTADQRLAIVLRFLRLRAPSSIAKQLGLTAAASGSLLCRALFEVAVRLELDPELTERAQVDRVAAFVSDLVARRRPLRFEAGPGAWAALLAATHLQAAIAGNDLPRLRFVRSLDDLVDAGIAL
jgi:hypothetical protein